MSPRLLPMFFPSLCLSPSFTVVDALLHKNKPTLIGMLKILYEFATVLGIRKDTNAHRKWHRNSERENNYMQQDNAKVSLVFIFACSLFLVKDNVANTVECKYAK